MLEAVSIRKKSGRPTPYVPTVHYRKLFERRAVVWRYVVLTCTSSETKRATMF